MFEITYKIEDVKDREGNEKVIPQSWLDQNYSITSLLAGTRGYLAYTDGSGNALFTSTVESISIVNNKILLTTKNTVYTLKPIADFE